MSRPLELTVHRKFEDRLGAEWYVWQGTCVMPWIATEYATRKRLTDAELAAEGYKMQNEMLSIRLHQADLASEGDLSGSELFEIPRWRKVEQMNTLHRFATLPSYDEVA